MTNREFSNNDIDLLKTGFDTCRNADILKLYCNRPFHVHKEGGQFAVADCKGREAGDGTWRRGDMSMSGHEHERIKNTNGDKFSLSPFHCMIPIATIQCQGTVIGWLVRQSLAEPPSEP